MRALGMLCLALSVVTGCGDDETSATGNTASGPGTSQGSNTSAGSGSTAAGSCPNEQAQTMGTDGSTNSLMETWGSPCTADAECVAILGEGGKCLFEAVVFGLPGGYCSKECTVPAGMTFVTDAMDCDPAGGIDCIGQSPLFSACAPPCGDHGQCSREGYECRRMPIIAMQADPSYCLMPDCCENACGAM